MAEMIDIQKRLYGKSILITGAGGLVGSAVAELLLECNRVDNAAVSMYLLGRSEKKLKNRFAQYLNDSYLHIVEGDVTTYRAPFTVDFIIHAASPAHPLAYSKTPVDVMKANLLGTISMLELARECGARILFISSGEIYGISDDPNCAFTEEQYGYIDPQNSRSCYPESKRAAETLCASYCAQYRVESVVARLCHVYGRAVIEANSRADAQFLRCALEGRDIVMKSAGSQVRSFCYVKDAATALLYVLLRGENGAAYNVANRDSIASIWDYASTLAKLSGVGIQREVPDEDECKGYTRIMRAVLDATKLESLGWHPQYLLKAGISDMLQCNKSM